MVTSGPNYRQYSGYHGFPGASMDKQSACNAGDAGSIPGQGRFPGGGHGNQLQYSWLENPMDRGAQRATVHGVAKQSGTAEATDHARTGYQGTTDD